jgi:hypothetical protein
MRLDLKGTDKYANELLAMIGKETESDLILEAHHAGWTTRWPRAELEKSLAHSAAGIELYRPEEHMHWPMYTLRTIRGSALITATAWSRGRSAFQIGQRRELKRRSLSDTGSSIRLHLRPH